jgi:hypothetical protein
VVEALPGGVTVNFFCKEPQLIYARNEINFKKDVKINYFSKYSENEFSWIEEEKITWERYQNWKQILLSSPELSTSELIISDNHVLPLSLFDRVLLMGSFLWHDATVPSTGEAKEIIAYERELLRSKPSSLICLGDMVMPSLANQVSLLKQGWFTQRSDLPKKGSNGLKVLVTGGGTELINKQLLSLTLLLSEQHRHIEFFLDSKLYGSGKNLNSQFNLFSFSEDDFASLDFVICRPGIGILTDCVRYSIPAIVLNDGFNHEINHNAKRVNELGIGIGLDINERNSSEVAEKIGSVIKDKEFKENCINQLRSREVNGAISASEVIINFL